MLMRLLLVLLVSTGLVPVGVCTCTGAARPASTRPVEVATQRESHCCCHPKKPIAVSEAESRNHCDDAPPAHDPNCPALHPVPVLDAAIPSPSVEWPSAIEVSMPAWITRFSDRSIRTPPPPVFDWRAGALPRYLFLLSLRI